MSTPPLKDVLLVGYGAVGAIYALILKRSGLARVTVVARGNYEKAVRHGIHIQSQKYGDIPGWRPDRLVSSVAVALDRPYSYVVVATKALPELTQTSTLLAPLLSREYSHPQPAYVLLQNGLGVERDLYDAVKGRLARGEDGGGIDGKIQESKPRVISSAVYIGTNLVSKDDHEMDIVEHNDFDRVSLGMYRPDWRIESSTPLEDQALLDDFAGMLVAGGSTVSVVPEIQRVKFKKNFWNIAFSSVATLTGYPLTAVFRDPAMAARVVPVIREVMEEMLAVGRALGFDEEALPASIIEQSIEGTRAIHERPDSRHRASMLLDRECGRPLEVEVIVGEVVRKAKEVGVAVPRIEMLYALLQVIQGQLVKN